MALFSSQMVEEQFFIGGQMLCKWMVVCLSQMLWHMYKCVFPSLPSLLLAQELSLLTALESYSKVQVSYSSTAAA